MDSLGRLLFFYGLEMSSVRDVAHVHSSLLKFPLLSLDLRCFDIRGTLGASYKESFTARKRNKFLEELTTPNFPSDASFSQYDRFNIDL
jgi:hypothetical protein